MKKLPLLFAACALLSCHLTFAAEVHVLVGINNNWNPYPVKLTLQKSGHSEEFIYAADKKDSHGFKAQQQDVFTVTASVEGTQCSGDTVLALDNQPYQTYLGFAQSKGDSHSADFSCHFAWEKFMPAS